MFEKRSLTLMLDDFLLVTWHPHCGYRQRSDEHAVKTVNLLTISGRRPFNSDYFRGFSRCVVVVSSTVRESVFRPAAWLAG